MKRVLEASAGAPLLSELGIEAARQSLVAGARMRGAGPDVHKVESMTARDAGHEVPVRVYWPTSTARHAVLFFHGGGWALGNLETADRHCRLLAWASGSIVVSVDYRLAPEHLFPAATDDAWCAARWLAASARELGAEREEFVVAGDSAGGNLAAGVALRARGAADVRIILQVLVYPVTDHDLDTGSYLRNGSGFRLERSDMAWFWDLYAPTAAQRNDPLLAPLRAPSHEGLPRTVIVVGTLDPLLDDSLRYAEALSRAGVPTTLAVVYGVTHGFLGLHDELSQARQSMHMIGAAVRAAR
jgi:acetyl esterase